MTQQKVDTLLQEVADWCESNNWPPLHALVIDGATGQPAPEYDQMAWFRLSDWKYDVEQCIRRTWDHESQVDDDFE